MRDIRYKWNTGLKSVGISNEVELPQFRVLGHRQRQTVITLTTVPRPLSASPCTCINKNKDFYGCAFKGKWENVPLKNNARCFIKEMRHEREDAIPGRDDKVGSLI
ncbi:hypothetical protein NQ315_000783 [Exocentrus adspersus]|uniref:Uncharacterized protein n=1 Tax=Exocentrus adspersus TaxID=1586481 RepID=A0AAV8WE69_9CUCU|nr:hypothetical protein NQ315_000783 [Exocentrus adspersus]